MHRGPTAVPGRCAVTTRGSLLRRIYAWHQPADYKEFKKVNDTIFNNNESKQIAELQTIYETEKKHRQLRYNVAKLPYWVHYSVRY